MIRFAFRMEQYVQKVLRVRVVSLPSQTTKCLESLSVQVLQVGSPLHLLDLHLHAQVLPPHLQYDLQVEADVAASAGDSYHNSRAGVRVRICRLRQELPGQLRVELQPFQLGIEAWKSRRQYAICRYPQARQDLISDELLVYGEVKRPAEFDIVKGRLLRIQTDVRDAEARGRNPEVFA